MCLTAGCQLAEVGAATLGGHRAALAAQDCGGGQLGLRDEIVSKGECRAEKFAAFGGAVFGQGRGRENEIGFGYQPFEGI